jgi:hypothetical protein
MMEKEAKGRIKRGKKASRNRKKLMTREPKTLKASKRDNGRMKQIIGKGQKRKEKIRGKRIKPISFS